MTFSCLLLLQVETTYRLNNNLLYRYVSNVGDNSYLRVVGCHLWLISSLYGRNVTYRKRMGMQLTSKQIISQAIVTNNWRAKDRNRILNDIIIAFKYLSIYNLHQSHWKPVKIIISCRAELKLFQFFITNQITLGSQTKINKIYSNEI